MHRSHGFAVLMLSTVLMPGVQACALPPPPAPLAAPALTPAQEAEWEKKRAEGKAAAQSFQWAKARDAYAKTWAIKQDWKLAANLGRAELNVGKHRDAAEHLDYFMREAPPNLATETPDEWKELRDMLAKARVKVGALVITVEPAGAEVPVNGLPVGKAPLPGPVFVEPGAVVVEARADGYALGNASVKAVAGKEEAVRLVLTAMGRKADAGPPPGTRFGSSATDKPTLAPVVVAVALAHQASHREGRFALELSDTMSSHEACP
jgi:hypothetical protein